MSDSKIYMIRRRSDGLYSTGGLHPRFQSAGKMWDMKQLNSHLTNIYGGYHGCLTGDFKNVDLEKYLQMNQYQNPYVNCDIVEAELKFEVKEDVFRHLATRYTDRKKK